MCIPNWFIIKPYLYSQREIERERGREGDREGENEREREMMVMYLVKLVWFQET